ncbi:[acyl-carrier-protein] S-malonyltransferase [Entomortierella parvispora]|uniref:[acyl-carrier-protein] S-malonyltransferase n=1 Tax=Entomortierella parvispora TaxID=205924 RepID=A0A9P3M0D2_9FUNG|nr:[acyl-carrier-protein] S-malonyltransferase [Entomortierella parvispora]
MACSSVRSAVVDKVTAAPITTLARGILPRTSRSSTTSAPRATSSPILSSTSPLPSPRPASQNLIRTSSTAPVYSVSWPTHSSSSSNASSPPTAPATASTITSKPSPAVVSPSRSNRFVPRNRRSLTSAGGHSNNWAILFPGQGSQFVGMGKDLYDAYPAARQVVDEADDALGGTLKHVMFEGSQEDLTRTENAQPAILTTSIAMLRVLELERGFKIEDSCRYALGHSLGEYSALVATKAVTLQDAVKLVRLRGEAMTKAVTNKGTTAMSALVVRSSKLEELVKAMEEIRETLPSGELAEIANINSSFQVVISGTVRGVDHASRMLQARKIAARAVDLPVSAPFHCSLMQPAADAMREALKDVEFKKPTISVISNVTAKPIENVEDISDLLVRQVTGTVQWHTSIAYLREQEDVHDYISLGPGKVLANLLRKEYPTDFVKTVTTASDIEQW